MIKRSTAIATAAILLSLLVHFLGLSFTPRIQPEPPNDNAATDVVALGNTFEDVAKNQSEPVVPEKSPTAKPREQTVPEPEHAETLTSEALVASANPQRTNSPDIGSARVVQPDKTGPSEPAAGRVTKPETVEPSGSDEGTSTELAVATPVEPETITPAPKGRPATRVEPVEADSVEPALSPPVAPAPTRLAALPVPIAALPVTPAPVPVPSAVPVIPLERETVAPETPETTVEPTPEEPQTATAQGDFGGSDLAVVTSPRPPVSPNRPSIEPTGLPDGSTEFSETRPSPLIESPLTVYQRDGIDLFARQNGGARSGGLGSLDSRGPGNSNVTNYVGRVLVHLNRAPPVRLSVRGSARVFFEINADGTLARVDILDSTGSEEIERAAKAQVRNAAPFPRPPPGASRRLTFVYWNN